jgi:hypothetical protein
VKHQFIIVHFRHLATAVIILFFIPQILFAKEIIDTAREPLMQFSLKEQLKAKKLGLDPSYKFDNAIANHHIELGLHYRKKAKVQNTIGFVSLGISAISFGLFSQLIKEPEDNIGVAFVAAFFKVQTIVAGVTFGLISLITFTNAGKLKSKSKNEINSANSYKFN